MRIFGGWPKTYYFGLMPLFHSPVQGTVSGWIMPFIMFFFNLCKSLVTINSEETGTGTGTTAYIKAIEAGMNLVPTTTRPITVLVPVFSNVLGQNKTLTLEATVYPGAVCEEFMAAAQQVGTIETLEDWQLEIKNLAAVGTKLTESSK